MGDPANIMLSAAIRRCGTFTYQWYFRDGVKSCPSGTNMLVGLQLVVQIVIVTITIGLTASRTYAVLVDATGT
jgi:hypothetical protein